MNVHQAALRTGYADCSIRDFIKRGQLKAVKVKWRRNHGWDIKLDDLNEFINKKHKEDRSKKLIQLKNQIRYCDDKIRYFTKEKELLSQQLQAL